MDKKSKISAEVSANTLFPIYVKLEEMKVLLVGAGNVGLEKLKTIKLNAPKTEVVVIAKEISKSFRNFATFLENVELIQDQYSDHYLKNADIVFSAVNDQNLSAKIFSDAKESGKLCNCADKPELCHFYLGSVVARGDVKIAISTNGKSPTIAKRLKETLQIALPVQLDEIVKNMHIIRGYLSGDFQQKVKKLNELTQVLVENGVNSTSPKEYWKQALFWSSIATIFVVAVYAFVLLENTFEANYIWLSTMFFTGFFAQFVDGMLGMGYGVIATTVLLSAGVNPAIVSSRVHSTRVFSSGLAGYSHKKLGNVDFSLFKKLVIFGCMGAVIGALLACLVGEMHLTWVRPFVSVYTLYLGVRICFKAFNKRKQIEGEANPSLLASVGGLLDAFAGGGWGSLVTSTLILRAQDPKKVIGSVCLAEFFVVFVSALTFFIFLQHVPLEDIAAMIIGGLIAAPFSAQLAGRVSEKFLFLVVGGMVVLSSLRILFNAIFVT